MSKSDNQMNAWKVNENQHLTWIIYQGFFCG